MATYDDLSTIESIEIQVNPTPWTIQAFQTSLNVSNPFYVLCLSEKVSAYLIGLIGGGEASLLHIAVNKSSQRQGLATQLLSFWLHYLQESQAVDSCWLEVRQSNIVAQRVYQRLGFERVTTRKNYYTLTNKHEKVENTREDALIYRLLF